MCAAPAPERLNILRMLEEGKIDASEAARLLESLSADYAAPQAEFVEVSENAIPDLPTPNAQPTRRPRWFKVRVSDAATGHVKVRVALPFRLMEWGLRIGAHYAPEIRGIPLHDLGEMLANGGDGKLIDVIDDEDGEHVEIFVE